VQAAVAAAAVAAAAVAAETSRQPASQPAMQSHGISQANRRQRVPTHAETTVDCAQFRPA
jgi:hypothetical protein